VQNKNLEELVVRPAKPNASTSGARKSVPSYQHIATALPLSGENAGKPVGVVENNDNANMLMIR